MNRVYAKLITNVILVLMFSGCIESSDTSSVTPVKTEITNIERLEWPENPPHDWVTYHLAHPGTPGGGDPNPPFYYKGKYHLHYIFDDGNICAYAHVSSTDMVHWRFHPTVLGRATKGHGMYSGTGFYTDSGQPAIIYHGYEFERKPSKNWICYALDDNLDI